MAEDRTRIGFDAPTSLVERADHLAELLDTSRTRLVVDALRDRLDELASDETVRRQVREAYYASRIDFETAESVLGTEQAVRMKLLSDSLDRDPPTPCQRDVPRKDEFYDGDLPKWTPDNDESDGDTGSVAEQ